MTDQERWSAAVAATVREYGLLPLPLRQRVGEIAEEISVVKESYQRLAATVDADGICADCRGLCCGHGKHHFTVVDLLGYLSTGRELFAPDFASPVCPYHTGCGCLMDPGMRPLNCIIFLCDRLEELLPGPARQELSTLEKELRRLYICQELLLGNRFANGLLITFGRADVTGSRLFNY
ncbi:MAG TPA: hypothetical protein VFF53_09290 [Geobacteraceae bacterium]|nr:hypothetical protein [Geobacteraceae bacterium]